MSSPQSSGSQLDPSLTSGVNTLIAPFPSLSIEPHREEEVVQVRAVKTPKERKFLLKYYMIGRRLGASGKREVMKYPDRTSYTVQ